MVTFAVRFFDSVTPRNYFGIELHIFLKCVPRQPETDAGRCLICRTSAALTTVTAEMGLVIVVIPPVVLVVVLVTRRPSGIVEGFEFGGLVYSALTFWCCANVFHVANLLVSLQRFKLPEFRVALRNFVLLNRFIGEPHAAFTHCIGYDHRVITRLNRRRGAGFKMAVVVTAHHFYADSFDTHGVII